MLSQGACADKKRIATRAKALNLDAIHMMQFTKWLRGQARHGKGLSLYNRYFRNNIQFAIV